MYILTTQPFSHASGNAPLVSPPSKLVTSEGLWLSGVVVVAAILSQNWFGTNWLANKPHVQDLHVRNLLSMGAEQDRGLPWWRLLWYGACALPLSLLVMSAREFARRIASTTYEAGSTQTANKCQRCEQGEPAAHDVAHFDSEALIAFMHISKDGRDAGMHPLAVQAHGTHCQGLVVGSVDEADFELEVQSNFAMTMLPWRSTRKRPREADEMAKSRS